MESYRTEDEQIEALKRWWRENGRSTVIGIVLALGAVFGWQMWERNQEERTEQASMLYQDLLDADRAAGSDPDRLSTARQLAEQLKQDYGNLTYGVFGAMFKAKYAVQAGEPEVAEQELRWVLKQKPDEQLAKQARIRLAHVLLSQKQYEESQKVLEGTDMGSYAAMIAELRGDIHLAKGEKAQALAAYQEAKTELAQMAGEERSSTLLDMKIRDLQTAEPAATAGVDRE